MRAYADGGAQVSAPIVANVAPPSNYPFISGAPAPVNHARLRCARAHDIYIIMAIFMHSNAARARASRKPEAPKTVAADVVHRHHHRMMRTHPKTSTWFMRVYLLCACARLGHDRWALCRAARFVCVVQ